VIDGSPAAVEPPPFADRPVAAFTRGHPAVLVVALHGYGSTGPTLLERLCDAGIADRVGALVVAPEGPSPARLRPGGRQWYPITNITAVAVERSAEPGERLRRWVRDCQAAAGFTPRSTVVVGFSQGGVMAEVLVEPPALAAAAVVLASVPGRAGVDPAATRRYVVGTADRFVPVDRVRERARPADSIVEVAGLGHDMSDASLAEVEAAAGAVAIAAAAQAGR